MNFMYHFVISITLLLCGFIYNSYEISKLNKNIDELEHETEMLDDKFEYLEKKVLKLEDGG